MDMFVGVVAILILLLLLIFVRRPKAKEAARPKKRPVQQEAPDTRFHAVSLRTVPSSCDAAKALEGERFLSTAAPNIPLPDCDAPTCKCRYIHHDDRRASDDRRNPYTQGFGSNSNTGSFEKEQRKTGERRADKPNRLF
jgi:hypothetical protein